MAKADNAQICIYYRSGSVKTVIEIGMCIGIICILKILFIKNKLHLVVIKLKNQNVFGQFTFKINEYKTEIENRDFGWIIKCFEYESSLMKMFNLFVDVLK